MLENWWNPRFHANKCKLNVRSIALRFCIINRQCVKVQGNHSYQSYTAQVQPARLGPDLKKDKLKLQPL